METGKPFSSLEEALQSDGPYVVLRIPAIVMEDNS